MNHLSQQECLMKWSDFCRKGRRLTQTLAVAILKHVIDPEIVKVIINIWELMAALTKDIDGQPATNVVREDQTVGDVHQYSTSAMGRCECVRKARQ